MMYGQYGVAGTLPQLAKRLRAFGIVTEHGWNDYQSVMHIVLSETKPVVLIGYSLGGNSVANIPRLIRHDVRLVVGYDPSRQSPTCAGGSMPVPDNLAEAVCYYNPGTWYYGGCRYFGKQVTLQRINMMHLLVPRSKELHEETYRRVERVAEESKIA